MPLSIIIEPLVEGLVEPLVESVVDGAVELAGEVAEGVVGESLAASLPLLGKSYSEAYCDSFYCYQCPGTAKTKRAKLGWYLYRCQDCGSAWGVLKAKPWVRREKRRRETLAR